MPIYEYECRQCGHRFEYLVLSSTRAAECPACKHKDLTQLISLCSMSSESSREANLSAAHKKVAGAQQEKQREDHKHLHDHFD
ncbi:MAG TPA: zinc ribbon domain-containing protein [Bryobacteraceae bacterium]|nr:zinc ribbon domain-containing protein [Bryobacteraceae bacterium]